MAKRRVSSEDLSSDDDYTAASTAQQPTKARRQPVKKKLKPTISDKNGPEDLDEEPDSQSWHHAPSIHIISSPKPLRVSLLEWYAGVHELRGMPWRKPYNSSLNRDGRAQRAYEVCEAILLWYPCQLKRMTLGMGI
jgi:A/G-specific adenine glycosylase